MIDKLYMSPDERAELPIDERLCEALTELWCETMPDEDKKRHTLRLIREFTVAYRENLNNFYHMLPKGQL